MGVLGSGENGVKRFREQGAEDFGHFIKQFYMLSGFFFASLRWGYFLPYIVHFHQ